MVLTRRAYKSIARWLPNEVITEIIQAAPPRDQASLCRTTKLFEGLGVPILYRVVNLQVEDAESIEAFCSTIASHTSKFAKLVRSFTANANLMYYTELDGLNAPLWECVKTLFNLEKLRIRGSLAYGHGVPEWLSLTFPRLDHGELYVTGRDWTSKERRGTLASFLLRHPALKSVRITDFISLELWPPTATRIPLHDLQRIWAPPTVFPALVVDDLREVRLDWQCDYEVNMTPAEPTFIALSAMARDGPPDKIPHVKKHLPRFTHLEFFAFESLDEVDGRLTFGETEAEDQLTVHDFGDLCPTLQACRLSKNAWRRVNGTWERFPADDFLARAGITLVDLSE
ncbi:hypothetical protein B0H16DRAFT_1712208 [Mycena metata]|uniref:F-box domain-containing protein n=1 Tax=Mycena metata TaxID=1033252 RepID=A0AAD7NVT8_9AGAR|nr:hypothetical protein B0H16DRAFT_1712208 [Mycena metata]